MKEQQNLTQNQTAQPSSPINWERLEALMASAWEQLRENAELMKETDRQMKETDRQMKETDRQMKETDRRIEESRKETDRQMQETDQQIKKLSEEVHHLMKRSSLIDNQWGRFLEEMCVPAAIEIFMNEGIDITQRYTGITHAKDDEGNEMEVDAILCNTTEAVALEVKADCSVKHIDHFLKQLQIFKKVFHPFDRYKVYAAIVGVKFQHGAQEYARKKGLYVIDCTADGIFSLAMKPTLEKRLCL